MSQPNPPDASRILTAIHDGRPGAVDEAFSLIYSELHRLARHYLSGERVDHTLQPTALVHEAYLKMAKNASFTPEDQAHFKAIAARAMRRTLVDHARKKNSQKRGGDAQRITLDENISGDDGNTIDILALDEALTKLEQEHERMCQVVELRFFAGLTEKEIADSLGVSERTVREDWSVAKLFLGRHLQ